MYNKKANNYYIWAVLMQTAKFFDHYIFLGLQYNNPTNYTKIRFKIHYVMQEVVTSSCSAPSSEAIDKS